MREQAVRAISKGLCGCSCADNQLLSLRVRGQGGCIATGAELFFCTCACADARRHGARRRTSSRAATRCARRRWRPAAPGRPPGRACSSRSPSSRNSRTTCRCCSLWRNGNLALLPAKSAAQAPRKPSLVCCYVHGRLCRGMELPGAGKEPRPSTWVRSRGAGGWGAQIEVWARSEEDFRLWDGWVHSRLRQLVMRVEPFVLVRPWPKARPGASPRAGWRCSLAPVIAQGALCSRGRAKLCRCLQRGWGGWQ